MKFTKPLESSVLLKRYKRFLADVIHPELGEITVHCPNTGSMKNCWQPGWKAWLLDSESSKRKYQYTWVLSETNQGDLIGVNTHFANNIVYEALQNGKMAELADFKTIEKEVKYGEENSRIDILLTDANGGKTYVEVKSVTLLDEERGGEGAGYFPDSVTTRGQKHLRELIHCVNQGDRAVLFFLVQHTAIESVSVANHIDPEYASLLQQAVKCGVEVIACNVKISTTKIYLDRHLPFVL